MNIYDHGLEKTAANFVALSPTSFVERSAEVFGDLEAVVHGARRYTWRQTRERSARLAAALRSFGVGRGTTVSAMLHNTPEMVEAHYAVPALNAVLNTLNTRLDAPLIAWQLAHCECAVLITDRELAPTVGAALALLRSEHGRTPVVIDVCDSEHVRRRRAPGRARVRGLARRARAAGDARRPGRRMGCDRDLVHLGDDRRPERRRHPSPRRLSERSLQRGDLDHAALPALPVDAADVPLQRLVLPVDGGAARWHACLPAQGRGAGDLRCDPQGARRPLLRRADRPQPAHRRARDAARRHRRTRCGRWSPAPRHRRR